LRELAWGCEHFGLQILIDDLVVEPLPFAHSQIHMPAGPGRKPSRAFEDGVFQAPVIDRAIPLFEGCSGYVQVARGEARGRLVLAP
jgi:hypothetical protein